MTTKTHDIAEFVIVLRDELAAHYAAKGAADGEPWEVSSFKVTQLASTLIRAAHARAQNEGEDEE